MQLTPRQIQSARAALGWEQADLARHAAVSLKAVQAIENGESADDASIVRVRAALQSEGALEEAAKVSAEGLSEVRRDPFDG